MTLLSDFTAVSIDELNEKNLLSDRQDRKYIFSADRLDQLLTSCLEEYDVLEINGKRNFRYATTYYDTPHLDMYHEHQRGKKNRCKIRSRQYLDTNMSFFEIKIKNNKERTVKHRIKGMEPQVAKDLIANKTIYSWEILEKIFELRYNRITLLHKRKMEKVTLDTKLSYRKDDHQLGFDTLIFAEVKTATAHDITFCNLMKSMEIRGGSLSKYCLGVLFFYPDIKQNNFKLSLKKLLKTSDNAVNGYTGI